MNWLEFVGLIVVSGLFGVFVSEIITRQGADRLILRLLSRILSRTPSADRIMKTFERDPSLGWSYSEPASSSRAEG